LTTIRFTSTRPLGLMQQDCMW